MKATLTFTLPEEQSDLNLCLAAPGLYSALWDFDQWLRGQIKYWDRVDLVPIRNQLRETLDELGVDLEGLA